jgi:hypothetical protein
MTLGDELSDPEITSFPALIANHFGLGLHNAAHSGSSNCQILRTTLLWIAEYLGNGGKSEELFVLIGWTAPDRREIGKSHEEGTPDPNRFWRDIFLHCQLADATPDLVQLHKLTIRSFWCDRESMTRFLIAANAVQGLLKSHGIRFCFLHAMPISSVHPELYPLVSAIDAKHFFRFLEPQRDFFSVSHDPWQVRIGALGHPLEESHRRWSALLIDYIAQECLL